MIRFLLKRPIAVIMLFLGLVIIGVITFSSLPVSLLPDIPIPEISVQIKGDNTSARELENIAVKPIRQQLMQVGRLRDIRSETRDGNSIIRLIFEHGTDTDLAFVEVNEKVDASMNRLPRNINRPQVIKASASDIPVFYINISLKSDSEYKSTDEKKFLELSTFAENVVKRRVEQLSEVAMADITGLMYEYVQIIPDVNYMETANIHLSDIENALQNNNIEPESMIVRDGFYEYNIKFTSILRTIQDIENVYLRKGERILQLKDIAKVKLTKQPETGISTVNGKRAITIGVIKQADETMQKLKESLENTLEDLKSKYTNIDFIVNRNQTELLDYTIGNLKSNLSLGFILVFIVALLFIGDAKSPIIIGISMITALIISFVFFYIFKQSLNIISLSGMILAIGMMIDSSIIITDIITQYKDKGYSISEACIKGTNEVITPVLSSTFTTISVFLPLVFLSGISGAIFFDQAFAVSVGLLVSYFTGIILLPVLYNVFYSRKILEKNYFLSKTQKYADKIIFSFYEKGFNFIFKHKKSVLIFSILTIPLSVLMFKNIPSKNMPDIKHSEVIIKLEWNENIHVDENNKRVNKLLLNISNEITENACYIGQRQYLLDRENNLSTSEAQIYLRSTDSKKIELLKQEVSEWLKNNYPKSLASFSPPENVFEKIFDTDEPDIITQLYTTNRQETPETFFIKKLKQDIDAITEATSEGIGFEKQLIISVDKRKLLLYGVEYSDVQKVLKTAFKDNKISVLRSFQQYLPISISGKATTVNEILQKTLIYANKGSSKQIQIPIKSLLKVHKGEGIKTIVAGKNGEYIPLLYYNIDNPEKLIKNTEKVLSEHKKWDAQFSGSFFSSKKLLGELSIVLLISVLLMYFILAAQFESFIQPLIVLAELPIDIAFALLILWGVGHSLNLMSAIGIIVACGVIINDSILKIDMINELRKTGIKLNDAIHTAGVKRLRSIVMTSLTTIFAMAPLLFAEDMGSELQKPLAIALISTMTIGTLVSMFVIPLIYHTVYKKSNN